MAEEITINWSPSDTLFLQPYAVQIYNSTIAKNKAKTGGGGIYNNNNSNNPYPAVTFPVAVINFLVSTIVADNIDESLSAPDIQNFDDLTSPPSPGAGIGVYNNNLIGNNLGVDGTIYTGDGNNDKAGTNSSPLDPLLDRLRRNGGFTQTMQLFPGSPAINAGANPLDFFYDQREAPFNRVVCGVADIGAYELDNCF